MDVTWDVCHGVLVWRRLYFIIYSLIVSNIDSEKETRRREGAQ